ncbi:MAG: Baseplate J-like protein, partial [Mucilaginibacter sp.]|nr:Baseplate J-like protein [Mucilaginibacter sp.]
MANNCFDTRLLSYSGTSQPQRALDALLAHAAEVDERKVEDLILFTKKYGAYLNYYDLTNAISGDWQGLMSNDVAVVISWVADWDTKDYAPFIKNLNDRITSDTVDADKKDDFKIVFDFVFSVASAIDQAYKQLSDDIDYYTFLSVSVSSKLAGPLSVLFQYYNLFKTNSLIDDTSALTDPLIPVDTIVLSQNFDITALSAPFNITPPVTAYPITLSGVVQDDINHILTHNLFTGALQSFTDAIINIVSRTPGYLAQTLSNYPTHAPHYALYLTFLKLFSFAQKHLNHYTKKHLDFYYKSVLQLKNNAAVADYVHLVFELQKNINQYLLPKGTSFKAGKDANNNDLYYSLTDDTVVQTAQVQALRSIYLNKDISAGTLFAYLITNSEDGQGGKLLSADNSWFPFGSPQNMQPTAAIGFAISSNALYLNEGTRTIVLLFTCDSLAGIANADLSELFSVQLTGKKNWYTVSKYTPNVTSATTFSLSFTIDGDAPAIIPYSSKIHGGNFTQLLPMVQLILTGYASYQKIKIPQITKVTISVSVDKVKNLSLQNDDGKINTAKPFKPFGDFPEDNASFIIGSKEIFQKKLTNLSVNFDWQQGPLAGTNVSLFALGKGNWSPVGSGSAALDASGIVTTDFTNTARSPMDFTPNGDYTVTSIDGFIKLGIAGTAYNLSTFVNNLPKPSVTVIYDTAKPTQIDSYNVVPGTVKPAPAPIAKAMYVTYSAEDTITFSETTLSTFNLRSNFYYHIEPFGYREMHPFINQISHDGLALLPVFNLDDGKPNLANNNISHNGGELWIGLSNANADETFSLLFQVSDGSANPLKNMTKVDWYYLNDNNWLQFNNQSVTDQTNNLTTSGLVIVNVPSDATLDNTRADNGLLWIKAVVQRDTDAICNLIAVDTNAAKAQFVQNIVNNIEFTKALLPNTISKPAVADAALKKTQQPYPSFDGRVKETDSQFYLRVSER